MKLATMTREQMIAAVRRGLEQEDRLLARARAEPNPAKLESLESRARAVRDASGVANRRLNPVDEVLGPLPEGAAADRALGLFVFARLRADAAGLLTTSSTLAEAFDKLSRAPTGRFEIERCVLELQRQPAMKSFSEAEILPSWSGTHLGSPLEWTPAGRFDYSEQGGWRGALYRQGDGWKIWHLATRTAMSGDLELSDLEPEQLKAIDVELERLEGQIGGAALPVHPMLATGERERLGRVAKDLELARKSVRGELRKQIDELNQRLRSEAESAKAALSALVSEGAVGRVSHETTAAIAAWHGASGFERPNPE